MGSEPGNDAPPSVWPSASLEASVLPQSIRWNIDAMGSMTGLHSSQQETCEKERERTIISLLTTFK